MKENVSHRLQATRDKGTNVMEDNFLKTPRRLAAKPWLYEYV